MMFDEH